MYYTMNGCIVCADELIQLLSRLQSTSDYDASCRLAQQIVDFLELHTSDYRLNQAIQSDQNTGTIFKSLQQIVLDK